MCLEISLSKTFQFSFSKSNLLIQKMALKRVNTALFDFSQCQFFPFEKEELTLHRWPRTLEILDGEIVGIGFNRY